MIPRLGSFPSIDIEEATEGTCHATYSALGFVQLTEGEIVTGWWCRRHMGDREESAQTTDVSLEMTSAAPPIATPLRPRVLQPGLAALETGTERYIVRGGGSMTFAIEAGDHAVLSLLEGGQAAELVAFGLDGRDRLAALGLQPAGGPSGLQRILSSGSEDAQKVRSGLSRRNLDLGKAKAAYLFGVDTPAGAEHAMTAASDLFLIIAAPGEAMLPWDQAPPSDILVTIRRARILPPGKARLPEPLAEPRLDLVIEAASAIEFEVYEGEYIQIIDVAGRQCSDFLAFSRKALDKGRLRGLDATTTRTFNGSAYPQPGLASKFFDQDQNALVEVIQDTIGRHDTFGLACTARYYEDMGYFGHVNCSDNLSKTLAQFGIESFKGWPAINFFFNTNVNHQNQIWADEPWSRPGDYVLLRAMADLVCAASSCPDDIDPANGWYLSDIHVRVYPKTSLFKRAIGFRMTPDAPTQLTRETGFHPRTSALTRSFAEYKGYWMPSCFTGEGPVAEYWACRERAAIMDLSPLRKLEIMGPDAEALMQHVMTRDVRKLSTGQVVYSAMCYDHGGMIDDGTLFRMSDTNFRWIGGSDDSILWIKEQAAKLGSKAVIKSASEQLHNIAVQGPKSREILKSIIWTPGGRPTIEELGWFRMTVGRIHGYQGIPVMVSRTGYTGELGYEVFCHPKDAPAVWDAVMEAGEPFGIAPFGFSALDMVRIEAGLIIAGNDFDATVDPFEAGIGFAVPAKKDEFFIGKDVLDQRRAHPRRQMAGLQMVGSETPGHGDPVFVGRAQVGIVTSATRSPVLKASIALARLETHCTALGTEVEIGKLDGHQKRLPATVVRFPFYDPEKLRVRA
jgi:aminomethyltransferase